MKVKDKTDLKRVYVTHLKHKVKTSYRTNISDIIVPEEVASWYDDCEKVYVKDGALILIISTGDGETKELGFSLTHVVKWEVVKK